MQDILMHIYIDDIKKVDDGKGHGGGDMNSNRGKRDGIYDNGLYYTEDEDDKIDGLYDFESDMPGVMDYNVGDLYFRKKKSIEEQSVYDTYNDWMKSAQNPDQKNKKANPFHFDMYHIKMSKSPQQEKGSRELSSVDETELERVLARLKKFKSLDEKLKFLNKIKRTLIARLKLLHQEEEMDQKEDGKKYGAKKVSYAEKKWKTEVAHAKDDTEDNFINHFQPLVKLGDDSALF